MGSEITIGGQAVIEGVMMRSKDKYAICVRKPDNKISTKVIKIKNPKNKLLNMPIVRGCIRFVETLKIGIDALSYSAQKSMGEKEEPITPGELTITVLLSIGMALALFYLAPLLLTRLITSAKGLLFNIVDGIFRLVIFILYLAIISFMPDIKRIFQYHGAEHKTVFCYENNEKLTIENVKKYSTLHPRCGTNFILIVFITSIFFISLVNVNGFFPRLIVRLAMLPVIAGASYEILKFSGSHFDNKLVKAIIYPGLLIQKITTKEPDDKMIEVAIKSLKAAVA